MQSGEYIISFLFLVAAIYFGTQRAWITAVIFLLAALVILGKAQQGQIQ